MSSDPGECRDQALQCERLAAYARTPRTRQSFRDLAIAWNWLAGEIENTQVIVRRVRAEAGVGSVRLAGSWLTCPFHACAFFGSKEEEEAIYLPFMAEGIAAGHKCVHILDDERREEKLKKLGEAGIDVATAERVGQLELRPWEEAHAADGQFNKDAMLDGWERAASSGDATFPLTRLWSNQEWALKDIPGVEDLIEYEAQFNYIWPKSKDCFVCVYDTTKFGAHTLMQLLRTHPFVVIGSTMRQNPFYVPPDDFLRDLHGHAAEPKSS